MQLITCIGFSGTGSSAINNILRELNDVCDLTPNNECRFLQDPDGIRDLEYNLFDCRHRLNSDYAIKRYRLYAFKHDKRNFKQIFGGEWEKLNLEFLSNICSFEYNGYRHADLRDLTFFEKVKFYSFRAYKILAAKVFKISKESNRNIFPKKKMYIPINDRNKFLEATKSLTNKLFKSLEKTEHKFGIVDQLVPPSNIQQYLRYVEGLKVIVVDRDPRDVFLNYVPRKDRIFPSDVKKFCDLFVEHRRNCDYEDKNVIRIRFEDIIYRFDETFEKVLNFIGIDVNSINFSGKFFKIKESQKNTKLRETVHGYENEIAYIEEHLKEYLYNYDNL